MAKVIAAMDEPDQIPYSDFPKKTDGSIDSTFNYKNFKKHYWDGMDFTDDRLIRTPVFAYKLKFYLDKLTPQQPDSIMAACDWLIEKHGHPKNFLNTLFTIAPTHMKVQK